MSEPSVTVRRAPDGWTHIGGPGMHLLIALDEEDDLTLTASDAADGGDLDDVIDVLTAGGLRKSHHFVGVHWLPRTRVVAHGPVAATVTTVDGVQREIRAASPRVWTDVELDVHPASVDLRVLEEPELLAPTSSAGQYGTLDRAEPPAPTSSAGQYGTLDRAEPPAPTSSTGQYGALDRAEPSTSRPVPTIGAPADPGERPAGRAWTGNWRAQSPAGQPAPAADPHTDSSAEPAEPTAPSVGSAPSGPLPNWGLARPQAVRRPVTDAASTTIGQTVLPEPMPTAGTPAPSNAADRDIHSTWTSRPLEPAMREVPVPPTPPASIASTQEPGEPEPTAPSYDYLFGHTTAAEEHRKLLATVDGVRSDADDEEEEQAAPAVAPAAQPSPPDIPAGAAAPEPPPVSGGLISSVPWARSSTSQASSPASPAPSAPVPSFSGRRTPPPAPTLRPQAPGGPDSSARSTVQNGPVDGADVPGGPDPSARSTVQNGPVDGANLPARPDSSARSTVQNGPVDGAYLPVRPDPSARSTGGAPPVPQSIAAEPDDAELTVDRSALLQAAGGAGPTVMAVLCPSGHASPPHANRCRICGSAVPPQEAFAMPRPPLGVLRLSTGDVVTLDRNVLLGRAPKPALDLAPDAQPHVVKVPSPERDVSRNHVEVLVDGWHVLIRDLGTTNGTTVALPGEAPVRLRAHDELALEPDSVVSMADEVSFTFEVGG